MSNTHIEHFPIIILKTNKIKQNKHSTVCSTELLRQQKQKKKTKTTKETKTTKKTKNNEYKNCHTN